jgi:hypothetical protein
VIAGRSVRGAAVAAFAAAALGVVLTPVMATVAVIHPDIVWSDLTLVERTLGPLLESTGVLTFGAGDVPYRVYGKAFFVVYLLMLPIVRLVHVAYRDAGGSRRVELWSWRAMYVALLVALVGDVIAYWALSIPGAIGDSIAGAGFVIEVAAMVTLLVATAVYAVVAGGCQVLPRWAGWLFVATVPVAWLSGIYVVSYFPNAFVVPLTVSWAAIGIWLAIGTGDADDSPWPTVIDSRPGSGLSFAVAVRLNWVTVLTGLLGVFMVGLGLLITADPTDRVYGAIGILAGMTMIGGLSIAWNGRGSPRRALQVVGFAAGIAAVGYAWVIVPLVVGGIVVWHGIHNRRLFDELAQHNAHRSSSRPRKSM